MKLKLKEEKSLLLKEVKKLQNRIKVLENQIKKDENVTYSKKKKEILLRLDNYLNEKLDNLTRFTTLKPFVNGFNSRIYPDSDYYFDKGKNVQLWRKVQLLFKMWPRLYLRLEKVLYYQNFYRKH